MSFTPINPSIGGTNVLKDPDRFKDFPKNDPSAIANKILNYPVSVQASVFPGLKMGTFGFNLFATSKTNMVLRNAIHPVLDVDYRYDRGFVTGFAYNMGSGASASRIKKSSKTTIRRFWDTIFSTSKVDEEFIICPKVNPEFKHEKKYE